MWRQYSVDGYIVVYSITDRRSFQKACDVIASIRQQAKGSSKAVNKPLLLAANKSDLERARIVAKEGKDLDVAIALFSGIISLVTSTASQSLK